MYLIEELFGPAPIGSEYTDDPKTVVGAAGAWHSTVIWHEGIHLAGTHPGDPARMVAMLHPVFKSGWDARQAADALAALAAGSPL